MSAIARFGVKHRRLVLIAWLIVFAAAIAVGTQAREHIRQPSLAIPGSDSDRADKLTRKEFGGTVSMAILLEGPPKVVESRGPVVVRELQKIEGVQVLSPWAIGGARVLQGAARPGAARAPGPQAVRSRSPTETIPAVQRVLDREETGGAESRDDRAARRSCAR